MLRGAVLLVFLLGLSGCRGCSSTPTAAPQTQHIQESTPEAATAPRPPPLPPARSMGEELQYRFAQGMSLRSAAEGLPPEARVLGTKYLRCLSVTDPQECTRLDRDEADTVFCRMEAEQVQARGRSERGWFRTPAMTRFGVDHNFDPTMFQQLAEAIEQGNPALCPPEQAWTLVCPAAASGEIPRCSRHTGEAYIACLRYGTLYAAIRGGSEALRAVNVAAFPDYWALGVGLMGREACVRMLLGQPTTP